MRKAWATVLPFLVLLSGCSAFFETNVLKGLNTVSAPTAADYQGPGGLDRLAKDLSSPAIVAALKSDPAATASIASYLQTTYLSSPPLTTHDQQQAAVLYSQLCLKTTSGDQLVNNAVTIALGGVGTKSLLETMQEIVPPAVATDPVAFPAMVEGLLNANDSFALFGATVPPAPSGVNMGDVAQEATVAWMIRAVMSALETSLALTDSAADRSAAENQLYALLNNLGNSISSVPMPDPYSSPPGWLTGISVAAGTTLPS